VEARGKRSTIAFNLYLSDKAELSFFPR